MTVQVECNEKACFYIAEALPVIFNKSEAHSIH